MFLKPNGEARVQTYITERYVFQTSPLFEEGKQKEHTEKERGVKREQKI